MNHILVSAAWLALTLPSHALLLSFDSGSTTDGTGLPVTTSFTVDNAYLELLDDSGDLLPLPVWTPIEPARIGNPADAGYGDPISGSGALDAEFDQILFSFESSVYLREFSVILDDSPFGNLGESKIQFFDSGNRLLAEISMDQTQPRFVATLESGPISGVQKILLPSGAYYDDVTLNVPESGPGSAVLAGLMLGGAFAARRLSGRQRDASSAGATPPGK